jgi:hypothetical protein
LHTVAFTGTTDFRAGIWDASGALLATTANLSAALGTTSTMVIAALTASVALVRRTAYYVGLGGAFTGAGTLLIANYRGTPLISRTGLDNPLVRVATGYAGGSLPALSTSGSLSSPWVEVLA